MVVGHLPFLGKLAALLVRGNEEREIVEFHFGSVVCIEQRDEGKWRVAWMIRPAPIRTGVRCRGSGNIPASRVPPILRESAVEQREFDVARLEVSERPGVSHDQEKTPAVSRRAMRLTKDSSKPII
jgi:hypothetical protein